ncbi:MAG: dTMP kinase [Candidatus Micrarchaeota archaeon]
MKGKLICFEGIDGSGKGTQARNLIKKMPGSALFAYPDKNWPIGRVIANFLAKKVRLSPVHQFLLYSADIHKDQGKIEKLLKAGKTVILDRYLFSTLAYQGASGFGIKRGQKIIKELNFLAPDLTILLDINPRASVERKKKQNSSLERFEKEKFLGKVRKNYLMLAKRKFLSKKWLVVNGGEKPGKIAEEIRLLVLK